MDGVSVRRLVVDCAVPQDHPNPIAVRTRLDEAGQRLGAALGELLAPLSKLGDEVIVIPKLELSFELDTSLQPSELARVWAARIAAAVAAWLQPEAHATMVRFPDEAHYLARFLVDTVAGHAQQKWYYRRWRVFAALSTPAQLRSALVEEPVRGIAALAALTPSELVTVLASLGPHEARRVVETIASGAAADGEEIARTFVPLLAAWIPVAGALPSPWQAALALAARAAGALPHDVPAVVALAAALAAIAHPRLRPQAARAETSVLDGAGLPGPSPLLALSELARRALLAPLGEAAGNAEVAQPASWYTRLGGLLLLLPRIAELPLDELFGDEAGLARLAVLLRAGGAEHRAEVLGEPLWRHLCGVAPEADLDAWLDTAPIAERLAPALWERASADADRLHAIATRHEAPQLVLASAPGGEWLAITELTDGVRAALRQAPVLDVAGLELSAHVTHATAQAAARTLAWLEPDLASPADRALTIAAQHVLRAFARRLPGFAGSSPRFLYDSFLDFDATVVAAEDAFHCRVGRPRLAALFGLTGALRGRLSIGDGRVLELYPG